MGYVLVFFRLCELGSLVYLASLPRRSEPERNTVWLGSLALVLVELLASRLLQIAEVSIGLPIVALLTALFLIYSVAVFGSNVLVSEQSPETSRELCEPKEEDVSRRSASIEEACRAMGGEFGLTSREVEVLIELAYGHASTYIARVLVISDNTARSHMKNIYRKTGVHSRDELLELVRNR